MEETTIRTLSGTRCKDASRGDCWRCLIALTTFFMFSAIGMYALKFYWPHTAWIFALAAAGPVVFILGQSYVDAKRAQARAATVSAQLSRKGGDS